MTPIRIIILEQVSGMKATTEKPIYHKDGRLFVVHGKMKFNEGWINRNSRKGRIKVVFECYG